jgi:hypothetical protein
MEPVIKPPGAPGSVGPTVGGGGQGPDGRSVTGAWAPPGPGPSPVIRRGACYALFAYDIGMSVDLDAAERTVQEATSRETIKHNRRSPAYFAYRPAPLRLTQTAEPITLGAFATAALVDCVMFDFGAVSVAYTIPLSGPLSGLLPLGDALYENKTLMADSRRRVEALLEAVRPAVTRPRMSSFVEDYAIYQIDELDAADGGEGVVDAYSGDLARILRSEPRPLSVQEVQDALAARISYGPGDTALIDWNAAMVLGAEGDDDVRAVLEYANVELLEMRHLDDQLDRALDESYRALSRQTVRPFFRGQQAADLRRIAQLQIDGALLFEDVNNALKLLGDQYLARVYRSAALRLHLPEWDGLILRKLQTLESIYQKLSDHQAGRRMEALEWIVIVLIAVEIVLSIVLGVSGR